MERKVKLQITGMEKKYKNGDGVENINIDVYEGEENPRSCGHWEDFWTSIRETFSSTGNP